MFKILIFFLYGVCTVTGIGTIGVPKIFKKNKIKETQDPEVAKLLFNNFSFPIATACENHVCKSYNGKSNQMYGDAICRKAMEKMYPKYKELSTFARCKTIQVSLERKDKKNKNRSALLYSDITLQAVRCTIYGGREDGTFRYVANSTEKDWYYVFESGKHYRGYQTKCLAVLKILMNKETDFFPAKIEETMQPVIADDIFGQFGSSIKEDEEGHVCKKVRISGRPSVLFGQHICGRAQISEYVCERLRKINTRIRSECVFYPVNRFSLKTLLITSRKVRSKPVLMSKCWYNFHGNEKAEFFLIFNGPERNLYYFAEVDYKDHNSVRIKAVVKL